MRPGQAPVNLSEETIAQTIKRAIGFYVPWLVMFKGKIEPIEDEV